MTRSAVSTITLPRVRIGTVESYVGMLEVMVVLREPRSPAALVVGMLLIATACSNTSSDATDTALQSGSDANHGTMETGAPTLATGVDATRLAADIAPAVAECIRAFAADGAAGLFGFSSAADADTFEMGRPYGMFTIHKGPWLEFMGYWRVPVLVGGEYRAIAEVKREADQYVLVGLGSAQFTSVLATREKMAAVSAALDAGRAGLLRTYHAGGESMLAYEVMSPEAADPDIRVQSFGWYPSSIPGIDGSVDPPELSLAQVDETLPAE